jgi:hypothetical protein
LKQLSARWIRWLHIYASMSSCAIVLFFSVTGLTLNHPTWFGGDRETVRESNGSVDPRWLGDPSEANSSVSRLEVVEQLRGEAKVRGALKEFTVDESQCIVAFRAPGYTADTFIDRKTGHYELVESSLGWIAVFNDLHKGRDSGRAWGWVIDLSAGLLVFVSATGILLLFYINRHRKTGLVTAVIGFILTIALYLICVPR